MIDLENGKYYMLKLLTHQEFMAHYGNDYYDRYDYIDYKAEFHQVQVKICVEVFNDKDFIVVYGDVPNSEERRRRVKFIIDRKSYEYLVENRRNVIENGVAVISNTHNCFPESSYVFTEDDYACINKKYENC